MNEEHKPSSDPYDSCDDRSNPVKPESETPEPVLETPPVPPNPNSYGIPWEEMPPETEGNPGQGQDFFLALIGTIVAGVMLGLLGGYPIFLVGGLGVVLRFLLEKQNRALARGFMWGGVVCIGVPLILFALLVGTCFL